MVPVAIAPPQHMVTSAVVPSVRSSSCSAVVSSRAPVEPTGWPSAMAPPLTFTRSKSGLITEFHESTTDAKASLISMTSMSPMAILERSRTRWVASIGPSRW